MTFAALFILKIAVTWKLCFKILLTHIFLDSKFFVVKYDLTIECLGNLFLFWNYYVDKGRVLYIVLLVFSYDKWNWYIEFNKYFDKVKFSIEVLEYRFMVVVANYTYSKLY